MHKIVLLFPALLLGACASTPPASSDWNEVPLSPNTWWEGAAPYREAEYRIPLAAGEALEHMLTLQEGGLVVYEWQVDMSEPALLASEFHGHTERVGEAPGTLMFYRIKEGASDAGSLKAPFTGTHGWYFNNQSGQDIEIVLKAAGFFAD